MDGNGQDSVGLNAAWVEPGSGFGPGLVNSAVVLPGGAGGLRIPASTGLNVGKGSGFTAEAWVNAAEAFSGQPVIDWSDPRYGLGVHLYVNFPRYGYVYAAFVDTAGALFSIETGPFVVTNGVYHHVAISYERSSGRARLFVDGRAEVEISIGNRTLQTSGDLCIGHRRDGTPFGPIYFRGQIDEASLYDRALDTNELAMIYAAGSAGKCKTPVPPQILAQPQSQSVVVGEPLTLTVHASGTSLQYQWWFNATPIEGATNATYHVAAVREDHAGTYYVRVLNTLGMEVSSQALIKILPAPACAPLSTGVLGWWSAEGNMDDRCGVYNSHTNFEHYTTGRVGRGFLVSPRLSSPVWWSTYSLKSVVMSLECWVKINNYSLNDSVLVAAKGSPIQTDFGLGFYRFGDAWVTQGTANTTAGMYSLNGSTPITLGRWYHLALTYDGAVLKSYVDGQIDHIVPVRGLLIRTDAPFRAGGYNAGPDTLDGVVDEPALYARALSEAEIRAIYAAGGSGKCATPVAPFIYDQPESQSVMLGETAKFSSLATGTPPLFYQWWHDNAPIPGATNPVYTMASVEASDAGSYFMTVTNSVGSATGTNLALMVSPLPPCAKAPLPVHSWWRAEGDFIDHTGNNPSTLTGIVGFDQGRVGKGFNFSGQGAIVVPHRPSQNLGKSLSLELWYKYTGAPNGYYGLIAKRAPYPEGCNFGINVLYGNQLQVYFQTPYQPGYQGSILPFGPAEGVFHHLVAVYRQSSSNEVQILTYTDGRLAQSASVAGNLADTFTDAPIVLGADDRYQGYFTGVMDEVTIYGRDLSAAEVQELFGAGRSGKCPTPFPPAVGNQPRSQTVVAGSPVQFEVEAVGTSPFTYQWQFNGNGLPNETNNSLSLQNVQRANAGAYSVIVSNAAGFAASSNAVLTVTPAPVQISIPETLASPAGTRFTVPVQALANGLENAFGFSLSYDAARLRFSGAELGSAFSNGSLLANISQTNSGRVGVAVALPAGTTLAEGVQEVARLTFLSLPAISTSTHLLSFVDLPTLRQVSDAAAVPAPATYTDGQVVVPASQYEGDIAPRPRGDRMVSVIDWVQAGRFVARLDFPTNASEFSRADTAPRGSSGDGAISLADWVQTGRYAAGLDSIQLVGGPDAPLTNTAGTVRWARGSDCERIVQVGAAELALGQVGTVPVRIVSCGDENALAFSLSFDPGLISFQEASAGAAAAGCSVNINASEADAGRIGVLLALPPGNAFAAGTAEVLRVSFRAATAGTCAVSLGDVPISREVSDPDADIVPAIYAGGWVAVIGPVVEAPRMGIALSGGSLVISWPASAPGCVLEQSDNLESWGAVPGAITSEGQVNSVTLPTSAESRFYRLRKTAAGF